MTNKGQRPHTNTATRDEGIGQREPSIGMPSTPKQGVKDDNVMVFHPPSSPLSKGTYTVFNVSILPVTGS